MNDGICHIHLNTPECCFDGGDCLICPTCHDKTRVNDGMCDVDLLTEECCFDLGDCGTDSTLDCITNCIVPGLSPLDMHYFIYNGKCDQPLNQSQCCFDLGTCISVAHSCPSCPFTNQTENAVSHYQHSFLILALIILLLFSYWCSLQVIGAQ